MLLSELTDYVFDCWFDSKGTPHLLTVRIEEDDDPELYVQTYRLTPESLTITPVGEERFLLTDELTTVVAHLIGLTYHKPEKKLHGNVNLKFVMIKKRFPGDPIFYLQIVITNLDTNSKVHLDRQGNDKLTDLLYKFVIKNWADLKK